jgi:glycosyltransferase involved in cell wall biosynthesis
MTSGSRLSVLFASECLLPAAGGAERAALEWLGALAPHHRVRACFIHAAARGRDLVFEPPAGVAVVHARDATASGYWALRQAKRESVFQAVTEDLATHGADVVVTQLHASSAVIDAAHAVGVPAVILLPSYECLCKYAFDAGSRCVPISKCRGCERASELDPHDRDAMIEARDANERALARVERLVAPSEAVAQACAEWCGRMPDVIRPVAGAGSSQEPNPTGHRLLVATRWRHNKGVRLLWPLCSTLRDRRVLVTERGLPDHVRLRLEGLDHVRVITGTRIESLLANASLLLVPSQWSEPFGRVAFEGLAAGVPTLASAVGGLAEFVPPGQLVEPPDSIDAWVAAVRRIEQPAAWQQARRDGIAAVRALLAYSPLAQLEAALRETANAPGRAVSCG